MLTPSPAATSYRNPEMPRYPFCPGCGHSILLDRLDRALVTLQLDRHRVILVTDIGCVGMSDQYFATHTFHGPHGRSIAYATGIKLANPALTVVVLIGDGGCGIGGQHLIAAARRNIGLAVIVFNNFNFGMTGGEHSATTPPGALTASTPGGNLERPLDICATVGVNGAGLVYRGTQFDRDLATRIAEAIAFRGFALVDIWELCTAHYARANELSKSAMLELSRELSMPFGFMQRLNRPEFAESYRAQAEAGREPSAKTGREIAKQYDVPLARPVRVVLAGAAGGKIKSTATLLARAAMLCGLWCTQRDDYPTTVMSGHSVSEVILSPHEIHYTGIPRPDILVIVTPEGLQQVKNQLTAMDEPSCVYVLPELAPQVETRARKIIIPLESLRAGKQALALMALAAVLRDTELLPLDALQAAVRMEPREELMRRNLRAVELGLTPLNA